MSEVHTHANEIPSVATGIGLIQSTFALFLWGTLCCPLPVHAFTELMLQLDSSLRYDSNPLRFPDNANLAAALGRDRKSDTVLANDVRVAVIHPLDSPQTRLLFTGQLGHRAYDQLSQLNHAEYAYRAAFEWRWGDLWRGELGHRDDQQLYNYLNGSLTTRDLVRGQTDSAELALRISPDIELPVILKNRRYQYETLSNWTFDSRERSADASLRYQATTRSTVRAGTRSASVSFPRRDAAQTATLDRGYVDNELYVDADWQYSVMTRFSGRVATLARRYDTLGGKNFSAWTTEVHLLHDHSPLTRLTLDLWSRPYGLTDPSILYITATGVQMGARWQATAKTRFTLQATTERQNYQYAVLAAGQAGTVINRGRLGGSWVYAPTRDVRLYVDAYHERLDRGALGAAIAQSQIRAGVEYTFENLTGVAQKTGFGERRSP